MHKLNDPTNKSTAFASLSLEPSLQQGLAAAGFTHCTPIQAEALPIALAYKDVAGQAQTGTGKTIAFLLATMQKLLQSTTAGQPRSLILAPTRELVLQIKADADLIGKYTKLNIGCLIGGSSYDRQKDMLNQGVDILIATPGRLIDLFKQRLVKFHKLEVVVIDEADRMFDMGFIKDIRFILNRTPKQRLGLLFSATLSYKVMELAYNYMNQPQKVMIEPETIIAHRLSEALYFPANNEKTPLLIGLLRKYQPIKSIVFINTKRVGEQIFGILKGNGFKVFLLSGDVPQHQRIKLLAGFKDINNSILVATDVAARGLHVNDVSHVFNYDLPQDREDYVHRIGRTARAGLSGMAISLACENYSFSIPEIEEYIGHKIPVMSIADDDLAVDLKPAVKFTRAGNSYQVADKTNHKQQSKTRTKYQKKSTSQTENSRHKPIRHKLTSHKQARPTKNNLSANQPQNASKLKVSWWRRLFDIS